MTHKTLIERVASVLAMSNPLEPSGEWSVYDAWRMLPDVSRERVQMAIEELCPDGGRYVGGVSGSLYHLPR